MHGVVLFTVGAETDNFLPGQQSTYLVVDPPFFHFQPPENTVAADNNCRFAHIFNNLIQMVVDGIDRRMSLTYGEDQSGIDGAEEFQAAVGFCPGDRSDIIFVADISRA